MNEISRLQKFGPMWLAAAIFAFSPIAVLHFTGIVVLVATALVVAAVCVARYDSEKGSLSKRTNAPGFGRLTVLLRAGKKTPGFASLPVVAGFAVAAIVAPAVLKSIALIAFFALLLVLVWPQLWQLLMTLQASMDEAADKKRSEEAAAEAKGVDSIEPDPAKSGEEKV